MKDRSAFMTKTWVVIIGASISCALWGSAFPCVKIGYEMMSIQATDTAGQILYAGCRFFLAGILAVLFGSILAKSFLRPQKLATLGRATVLSFFQTITQYMFFYIGLAHTTGVKASIIEGMNAFVAVLIAGIFFRQERISLKVIGGCIIGFAGVVLVNLSGSGIDFSLSFTGEGFIFLSTVSYALSSVVMKKYSRFDNPVLLSGYQFIIGGAVMIIVGLAMGGSLTGFTPLSVLMLIYLAIISSVAYSLWGILLKYNPVSRISVMGFLTPVFGVVFSALFLGETDSLGWLSLLALVLVCIGIYIVNKKKTA